MNAIIEKLQTAGYSNTGDNRSYDIRSLNSLIEIGMIDFYFIPADEYNNGKSFWFSSKDKNGNPVKKCTAYKVMYMGNWYYGHFIPKSTTHVIFGVRSTDPVDNSSLSINDILCRVARLISSKREGIDFMKAELFAANGECSCAKCHGTGFIPQFAHYAQGVCFDCGGIGIDNRILKSNIKNIVNSSNK